MHSDLWGQLRRSSGSSEPSLVVWFGGERCGGREGPAASGAFIYIILSQWADSDKVPPHHLNDPSFSRVSSWNSDCSLWDTKMLKQGWRRSD
jgi:hypothetical protein